MTKLSDIQTILLSAGSQRANGSILPLPEALSGKAEQARKAIAQLVNRGLASEVESADRSATFREDGDLRFAAVITKTGEQAIGAIDTVGEDGATEPATAKLPRTETKQARVIELLSREHGASISEIVEATGWLPHTTRAMLTGIRKSGTILDKSKVDGVTRYAVAVAQ